MKRNLIIFAIICLSLILFTGCDEILEAFYPEFGKANNEIYIIVDIGESISIGIEEPPIMVAIIPIEDGQLAIDRMWAQDHYDRHIEADFYPLPGGNAYKVLVWQDANNNGKPDQEEPSIQVMHGDGWYMDDLFDFRNPDREDYEEYIEANAYLNNWDKIDYAIIQQFDNFVPDAEGGGEVGEYTDFSFQIEGPFTISKESAPTDAIYKIRPASDVPIIAVYGEMWTPDGREITFATTSVDLGRREIHIDFTSIDYVGDTYVGDYEDINGDIKPLLHPDVPNDIRLYLEVVYDEDGDNVVDDVDDPIGYGEFVIHFTTAENEAAAGTVYTLNIELERLGDDPLLLEVDQSYACLAEIIRFDARTGQYEPSGRIAEGTINGGFASLEIPDISYQRPDLDFVHVLIWDYTAIEGDPPAWVSDDISIYLPKDETEAYVFFDPWSFHEAGPKEGGENSEGTPDLPLILGGIDNPLPHSGKVDLDEISFYEVSVTPNTNYSITLTSIIGDPDLEVFANGFPGVVADDEWLGGSYNYGTTDEEAIVMTMPEQTVLYIAVVGYEPDTTYFIDVTEQTASGTSEGSEAEPVALDLGVTHAGSIAAYDYSVYSIPVTMESSYTITADTFNPAIDLIDIDVYQNDTAVYDDWAWYYDGAYSSSTTYEEITVEAWDSYLILFVWYADGPGGTYDLTVTEVVK